VEKIKLEQECDVCHAVRVVRQNREQFVPTFVSTAKDVPCSESIFLPSFLFNFLKEIISFAGSKCGI
jgi:hypothetical protein